MRIYIIILLLILASPLSSIATELLKDGPFSEIELSTLSKTDAQIIEEANEDFVLVLYGKKPRHSQFDDQAFLPADGGTTFYKGKGYTLTIVQSLSSFGKLHGYVYGPSIQFEKSFAPGNSNTIESLRFYTPEALKILKEKR